MRAQDNPLDASAAVPSSSAAVPSSPAVVSSPSAAVPDASPSGSPLSFSYSFVKQSDPWFTSQNAAALTRYNYQNMAEAHLTLSGEKGNFTNYYESNDATLLHTGVESYYRYNSRTVFFGSITYENFSGRHMTGSAFINPERKPFDLVEDSLTNQGTKHRDTYTLTGAFGSSIINRLSIGAKIDYTTANYAKYKDLRHQNKLMDLNLTAGLLYDINDVLTLGAHYLYHRNTETIDFGTYGTSDKVYKTLVSYANFTGHLEQFGQEGYTDKSREMPLVTNYNGLGTQLSVHSAKFIVHSFYSYEHGRGYYGRKSPYTITYTDHHTDRHDLFLQATFSPSCRSRHCLDFSMAFETLQNDANTYREVKNASTATYYEYYTPVKTADKQWRDYHLAYTLHLFPGCHAGKRDLLHRDMPSHTSASRRVSVANGSILPTWTFQAGINWHARRQTAYTYPYYRRQDISNYQPFASVCRNIFAAKGLWSLTIHGAYQKGSGTPYEDLTFQTPSDKQSLPPSMDAYLYQEYQYFTASQFTIGGSVRYAFIFPSTSLKTFAKLSIDHRKANKVSDHTTAAITLGCEF